MSYLPPRPLRVHPQARRQMLTGSGLVLAMSALLAVAFGVWQGGEARAIVDDDRIWAAGQMATDVYVTGRERSRWFVFTEYDLEVDYLSPDGVRRQAPASFYTLGELDREAAPEVAVAPDDPGRVAVSWAVYGAAQRWNSVYLLGGLGLVVVAILLVSGLRVWRRFGDMKRAAAESDELLVEVLEQKEHHHKGRKLKTSYRIKLPPGPPWNARVVWSDLGGDRTPMRPDPQHLIALVSELAPDRPVIVAADGYPFDIHR